MTRDQMLAAAAATLALADPNLSSDTPELDCQHLAEMLGQMQDPRLRHRL